MRELVVPPQTVHISPPACRQTGRNVHLPVGYSWRYDMGGPKPVLDVALHAKVHGSKEPQDVLCGYVRN